MDYKRLRKLCDLANNRTPFEAIYAFIKYFDISMDDIDLPALDRWLFRRYYGKYGTKDGFRSNEPCVFAKRTDLSESIKDAIRSYGSFVPLEDADGYFHYFRLGDDLIETFLVQGINAELKEAQNACQKDSLNICNLSKMYTELKDRDGYKFDFPYSCIESYVRHFRIYVKDKRMLKEIDRQMLRSYYGCHADKQEFLTAIFDPMGVFCKLYDKLHFDELYDKLYGDKLTMIPNAWGKYDFFEKIDCKSFLPF